MKRKISLSRRQFLSTATVAGAGALVTGSSVLSSCKESGEVKPQKPAPIERLKSWRIPVLTDKAIDGRELKVGLVGCGGQGTGDFIGMLKNAANGLKAVALGDVFKDKIDGARERIKKEAGQDVPEANCFVGFDAYKKVIDMVDLVLLVTPPVFRPLHFEAAVQAGKHIFMEKPICVDVAGALKLLAISKIADTKKLCVCTGTQRRHQRFYVESFKLIADGIIGEITGGNVYWNQGQLWYRDRQKEWSDMEWMIRDWVNWTWLSGDHIVEQHVHNIDIFNWFSGLTPVAATGFGARHRRVTGDQYDMFSVDYEYENGVHLHSMCRQIDGCKNNVSEFVHGTHGYWNGADGTIRNLSGEEIWKWDGEKAKQEFKQNQPYILEFVDLITAIRENKPFNETEATANSSLLAVLGRESAYTGKRVTWEDLKKMNMDLLPQDPKLEKQDMSKYVVPVPGKGKDSK
ncbi:MAG: Gfo/Idh/MocA family oxidoreductase [Prevotellaceae bacterium]|jgi:predicted dehydrogenase|nr:Gfo/Idh/MocA family oxidoreductase [Prevotellaceae bacterium]